MKNTNFERVEHTHGDVRTEQVVVHTKKYRSRWKLKVLSAVLALLIWLIVANTVEHRSQKSENADQSCLGEVFAEQI
jgi:hypothetical protein